MDVHISYFFKLGWKVWKAGDIIGNVVGFFSSWDRSRIDPVSSNQIIVERWIHLDYGGSFTFFAETGDIDTSIATSTTNSKQTNNNNNWDQEHNEYTMIEGSTYTMPHIEHEMIIVLYAQYCR